MGKTDPKQPKLLFENKCQTRMGDTQEETGGVQGPLDTALDAEEDMRSILLEMRSGLKTIDSKIDALTSSLDAVKEKVDKHETRLDVLENRLSDTHDPTAEAQTQILNMEKVLEVIRLKNEDLEARSRRNNLCILGLLESTAISKMEPYIDNLLRELFGPVLSPVMIAERAHRSLGPRPPPGAPPRPIIARLLNYTDRDAILREARAKSPITHQGNNLSFYPDYTPSVQAARREFLPVKKILQAASVPYAMLYPAKLKITHESQAHFSWIPNQR